ncbi:MAG: hypothetical protein NWE84_04075 [Candidatus Bathyarchaeota archaeon]|nr:hypothetical protein [Candidatus Bathyarchaeota archaeon]
MPLQKEQLKYSAVIAVMGSLLWLLISQTYNALDFSVYWTPYTVALNLSVFLGVFLVLSMIRKMKKPSFSLTLPVFLIYFAIHFTIQLIESVISYNSIPFPLDITLYEFLLPMLEYSVSHLAVFSLIGITAGIMMVRFTSKLKYDAFYFIFSTIIGVGAGTFLIKLSWEIKYIVPYSPLYPYLSILTLIGTLIGIITIQIVWLRKQLPSNIHTCISIAFWIIAFMTIIFIYEWGTCVQPPWF